MNHSIYSADRATHLKVIVSMLLACIVIAATALAARLGHPEVNAQTTATQTVYRPNSSHTFTEMARTGQHPI